MRPVVLAAAAALAACAQPQPGSGPATLPLARAELSPDIAAAATGEARFAVRAGTAAAECTAAGPGFRAAFAAPAEVAVPTFGPASRPIRVDCAAGGLRGARLVEPSTRRANGLAGWPAVGVGVSSGGGSYVSVGGFWNGGWGTGPQTVSVRYPDVDVPLD